MSITGWDLAWFVILIVCKIFLDFFPIGYMMSISRYLDSLALAIKMESLTGSIIYQRYRLDSELGHGDMAVMYRGDELLLERHIAVKVLSDSALTAIGHERRWARNDRNAAQAQLREALNNMAGTCLG